MQVQPQLSTSVFYSCGHLLHSFMGRIKQNDVICILKESRSHNRLPSMHSRLTSRSDNAVFIIQSIVEFEKPDLLSVGRTKQCGIYECWKCGILKCWCCGIYWCEWSIDGCRCGVVICLCTWSILSTLRVYVSGLGFWSWTSTFVSRRSLAVAVALHDRAWSL